MNDCKCCVKPPERILEVFPADRDTSYPIVNNVHLEKIVVDLNFIAAQEFDDEVKAELCKNCMETKSPGTCIQCAANAISSNVKEYLCPACANSEEPESCNHCLTLHIKDTVKWSCPSCANSESPNKCGMCLTSPEVSDDTKHEVCFAS